MSDSTENSKQIVTVGDQPAINDELGFAPYVIAMAEFLTHQDTKPPLTISIEGEWGIGKSSFMKQLEAEVKKKSQELDKEELKKVWQKIQQEWIIFSDVSDIYKLLRLRLKQETQTVWFNAWRHDKSDSLWATFALSFLEQLSKNRNFTDFLCNLGSQCLLFVYRLNFKDKPFKTAQTLLVILSILSMILAIAFVYWNVGIEKIPQWSDTLADIVKTDSKKEDKDDNKESEVTEKETSNHPLLTISMFLGLTGSSAAAIGKLFGIIRDLIGDPKMDLTQYLEHPDYDKKVAFVEKFHEDFSKIVNAYVGKDEKIYVFVDDLDRCELGKSADLLQGLNMMISNDPNIVFILGMDREKVAAAISFKQKDVIPFLASAIAENQAAENESQKLSKKVDYGFSFLEKFVQLSFSVPAPSQKTLDDFVGKILETKTSPEKQEKRFFGIPHSLFRKVFDLPARFNAGTLYKKPYLLQELTEKIKERTSSQKENEKNEAEESSISESQETETSSSDLSIFPIIDKDLNQESLKLAIRTVADFFDYNPRRLKQYINALRLRIYITYYSIGVTFAEKNTLNIEQVSKFTALTLQYPRLLLALKRNPDLLVDLEKYAVGKFIQSNYQFFQLNDNTVNSESRFNLQAEGNASYWINNYPKIEKLLCPEIESNNDQKTELKIVDKIFGKDRSIKKLLEVSPQGIPSKYFKLREFLAAKKWKEADMETYQVMLEVAGREKEGYLSKEDIEQFPCKDLQIIDQLWVKYSDGKFGFSVQKEIYLSVGGTREYNEEVWEAFAKQVGWLLGEGEKKTWMNYGQITLEREDGHLPSWELVFLGCLKGEGGLDSFVHRLLVFNI